MPAAQHEWTCRGCHNTFVASQPQEGSIVVTYLSDHDEVCSLECLITFAADRIRHRDRDRLKRIEKLEREQLPQCPYCGHAL